MDFSPLLEPIRLGQVIVGNRYALAPTSDIQEEGGLPNEQTFAFLAARARGGAGLVHVGSVQATEMAFLGQSVMQHKLYHPIHITRYAELADTIHSFGAAAFIQLIAGFGSAGRPVGGEPPYSASSVPARQPVEEMPEILRRRFKRLPNWRALSEGSDGSPPRPLTVEEIHAQQDEYATSARLAAMADFDGIEVHGCHEMLVHQFRSPVTNRRTDEYGGSFENRSRFYLELVQKTIAAVRPDFPQVAIGVRLSAREYVEGGFPFEETRDLTVELARLGITHISVTNAGGSSWRHMMPERDATNVEFARALKRATGLPVLCNNLHDPVNAVRAVEDGSVDMVNISRALIADPELPNKVRAGRVADIVRCTRCYICELRILNNLPIRCPLNPDVGREKYLPENWRAGGTAAKRLLPPLMRH
jgi:2,4-dienoyl-CoA reductase-like NADH-dependent reductase (Old Yellow Enzyme family)